MSAGRILLVEDDEEFGHSFALILKHKGFTVQLATSGEQALHIVAEKTFDVIVTDMLMPGISGLEFFRSFRGVYGYETPVVMLTGYGSVAEAVEAVKSGAFGYFLKPVNQDEICLTIEKAIEMGRLKNENILLREEILEIKGGFFLGESPRMRHVFEEAAALAKSDVNVLITGESGTGKEVVARFIHDRSPRAARPFVAINCQAYATTLIESELFGYRGGAFTGARTTGKSGKIQMVAGGTLFMDEIGDLELPIQVKMLRVLETHLIEPVGGSATVPVDFRLISATNQELTEKIKAKQFREDLFYRVNTIRLQVPPLRERKEDILPLAGHFLQHFAVEQKRSVMKLTAAAERRLRSYEWPGNVRELKNAMEAAVALTRGKKIDVDSLRIEGSADCNPSTGLAFADARQMFENNYFRTQYDACAGNVSELSRQTGVDRKQLYKKLYEYGIVQKPDNND
jgi:DNA-binding NtrC family response regulator